VGSNRLDQTWQAADAERELATWLDEPGDAGEATLAFGDWE
jgi:hypothetical protein